MIVNKDCIVIYDSFYNGNTKTIAESMSQQLNCSCLLTEEAMDLDLNSFDVIGFGSGIYFGTFHPNMFKLSNKLNNAAQKVFLFSTRGRPFRGKYHHSFKNHLQKKSKIIIGEFSVRGFDGTGPFSIFGGGNTGKPNERDQSKAASFIRNILPGYLVPDEYKYVKTKRPVSKETTNTYTVKKDSGDVKLKGDLVTVNHNLCIGCHKCVSICPLHIFEISENRAIPRNESDCILCNLCIKACPEKAIFLHSTWVGAIKVAIRHKEKCSLEYRKDFEKN